MTNEILPNTTPIEELTTIVPSTSCITPIDAPCIPQAGLASVPRVIQTPDQVVNLPNSQENHDSGGSQVASLVTNDLHTQLESLDSDKLYIPDCGKYVGNLLELPPPEQLQVEWREIILPQPAKNLISVIATLSPSLSRAGTTIESILCMSGDAVSKRPTVVLRSTVWIRCGSKTCRKAVQEALADLSLIQHLPIHVTLYAPRPAGSAVRLRGGSDLIPEDSTDEILLSDVRDFTEKTVMGSWTQIVGNERIQFQMEPITSNKNLTCGLHVSLRVSHGTPYLCTVGRLVQLDDMVPGLTTAHAIWDSALRKNDTASSSHPQTNGIYGPTHESMTMATEYVSYSTADLRTASYSYRLPVSAASK
ncbi:hypothetical protein FB567DRAFT_602649 [Paraphoma chrysanthemicola]|uniref:Uncharacterized protein n=1 Tax=Paraphoma chrysanthemicola TaxID=798071 RepID=A0A8K0R4T9_9PLEO|nr:hypothetical protein FB567DRAFT_602649 [Paraphoma chrysanthemicola]